MVSKKINSKRWQKIKELSSKKLHSLTELFEGKFPKELGELFSNKSHGVFPSLKEMEFSCSCPDWAEMCKHVSAALFAVGSKLDQEPGLIFKLRGTHVEDLIGEAVREEARALGKKRSSKTQKSIALSDAKLSKLFGVKLVTPTSSALRSNKKRAHRRRKKN